MPSALRLGFAHAEEPREVVAPSLVQIAAKVPRIYPLVLSIASMRKPFPSIAAAIAALRLPRGARESVVETRADGTKTRSEFRVRGSVVAVVLWNRSGQAVWGWTLRAGLKHGREVYWFDDGRVQYVALHVDGKQHGSARQWDERGTLICESRFVKGTGVDLWCGSLVWEEAELAEERWMRDGTRHGVERLWAGGNNREIWRESWFYEGIEHGIFREWNDDGRLRRGFPRYFVRGDRVNKRAYVRLAAKDETLVPHRRGDDRPRRNLPDAYVATRKRLRGVRTR